MTLLLYLKTNKAVNRRLNYTREEVKAKLPIIEAFAESETMQIKNKDKWADLENPDFCCSPDKYRIKPGPKYRPFKTREECWQEMQKHQPFGWVKEKVSVMLYLINGISDMSIVIMEDITSFEEAINIYEFKDGTPYGVKED